jgi:hypothetical protein
MTDFGGLFREIANYQRLKDGLMVIRFTVERLDYQKKNQQLSFKLSNLWYKLSTL